MGNLKLLLSFLFVALICNVDAFPTAQKNDNDIKHYQELFLRGFQVDLKDKNNGCDCQGYSCRCCVHADVEKIHLNHTVCVVLDYLPKELGLDVKLNIDDTTLFVEKVSLKNPPPLCAGIPHLEKYASICLVFHDISWSQKVGGCVKLDAKLAGITLEEIEIGCFFYPLNNNGEVVSAYSGSNSMVWQEHVIERLRNSFMKMQKEMELKVKQMVLEEDV